MRNRIIDETLYNIQSAIDHLNSTKRNILNGNFDNATIANINRQLGSVNNTLQYIHHRNLHRNFPNNFPNNNFLNNFPPNLSSNNVDNNFSLGNSHINTSSANRFSIRDIHNTLSNPQFNQNNVYRNSINSSNTRLSNTSNSNSHSATGIWDITNQLFQQMQQSQLVQNPQNMRFEQYDTPNGFHISISEFNSETSPNDVSESLIDSIMQISNLFNPQSSDEHQNNGLPEEYRNKLPKAKYKEAKTDDDENSFMCTICQEEYSDEIEVICLPCTHLFHEKCINGWLNKSVECPNCRSNIINDITTLI